MIKQKNGTFYSHLKAERVVTERDIDDLFKSIYTNYIKHIKF